MIQIGQKDIFWNYAATFLKIASSVLLFPFILRMLPTETVGIWSIFMTITAFASLLDFGFSSSFTRNVTYIFSGVRTLKPKGFESVTHTNQTVNYGLLKGVISVMRWFYLRIAIILFLFLATLGTYYIYSLLQNYNGDHKEVYIAWTLLCVINSYNLFTLYYDSLLLGKGLVKRSKQIIIIGQTVYLIIAAFMILSGYGLVAIVSAQASSVIIIRWLSYRSFFTREIKLKLHSANAHPQKEVLKAIYPNSLKIGLTSLGGFLVQRSAIIIGSLFLSLKEIASYGISMQLIAVIAGLAGIYTATYQPKIAQLRVENNNITIKELYLKGQIVLILTYIAGAVVLLFLGAYALDLIGSQTKLIPFIVLLIAIVISFLENNHAIAGGILLTNNEVPFFKASLVAGATTIILLIAMFYFSDMRLWAMILAPGIAQLYNNWKWPHEVFIQLNISKKDIKNALIGVTKFHLNDR